MIDNPAPDVRKLLTGIENPVTKVNQGIVEGGDLIGETSDTDQIQWIPFQVGIVLNLAPEPSPFTFTLKGAIK